MDNILIQGEFSIQTILMRKEVIKIGKQQKN
jgi:hypothetical protein